MLRRRLMKKSRVIPEGAVDLGLPSGTLWAKGNIVKKDSTYAIAEDGNDYYDEAYFSWGDIEPNMPYNETNYNNGVSGQGHTLTADFTSGDATYDAARATLGSPWRIPTYDEWNELINSCLWNWIRNSKQYPHGGLEGTGPNGGKIVLPFSGYYRGDYNDGYDVRYYGSYGYYWSSKFNDSYLARGFTIHTSGYDPPAVSSMPRHFGLSIRAVQ